MSLISDEVLQQFSYECTPVLKVSSLITHLHILLLHSSSRGSPLSIKRNTYQAEPRLYMYVQ